MKKYFIPMLLLVSMSTIAMPNNVSKNEKKATISTASTVESSAVVSMQQLQDENVQLKLQMLNLTNENEELKGLLSFQTMMQKMLAQLGAQRQHEEAEELKAQISYNKMMSKVVIALQTTATR